MELPAAAATKPPARFLILIPAYNEEERIGATLRGYAEYFATKLPGAFNILVVLNGCRDNTRAVVEAAQLEWPQIFFSEFAKPIGKGGALIEGLRHTSVGEFIGFVDADMATPPGALWDLFEACQGHDAVIGSRWVEGAQLHKLQSFRRRLASRTFNLIVNGLFGLHIKDTQCGAKVFRSQVIERIHDQLLISDMAFDVNLLVALHRAGFAVREVPTEWTDRAGSKVKLFGTSLRMLLSVIRLRLIYSPLRPHLHYIRPLERWLYSQLYVPPRQ